ncbi:CCR4-Not complex subunit Not2 [Schizosaccharomyces cryophilus OY26]|uniref:CCR4-Not complex subunit Not2 n=1 Tax=Schizosaccharomyces cryophilus (strain OY26 / ATCC MYA-4695 / CBS 11777 / NBRC 106824 / NRRL Y48691) TaxID=653667 RepID=S9VV70_SCHCR|nr:CCR4-Not complex subunit Not2 [Schizosaccharomyces cryophilus OY26]EPY49970.1 CCR4-Not complex subunit Not2 [Schizosaccharomyces cryophilus OY26]
MSLSSRLSSLQLNGNDDLKPAYGSMNASPIEKPNSFGNLGPSSSQSSSTIADYAAKGLLSSSTHNANDSHTVHRNNGIVDVNSHKNKLLGVITGKSGPNSPSFTDTTEAKGAKISENLDSTAPADESANSYSLESLLPIIRMEDTDLCMLQLGCDLSALGFDLAPVEEDRLISTNMSSPWAELNTKKPVSEPPFKLPECYKSVNPPPQLSKIIQFADETLFYIFYTKPQDILQEAAAQELTNRNWRFHKELRVWLTPVPGTKPLQRTPQFERGYYMIFDPVHWKRIRKDFLLMYAALEDRSQNAIPT